MDQVLGAEKLQESSQIYEQIIPEMGFREYWYPVCLAKEISERGLEMTPLGSPVLLLRRSGKIYAVANECPHRGTRLSLGRCQFPGTNTLTCVYHGWTYDVTNGNCVAALTDGPDSPLINKVRLKTYPVNECQGIVWIWMGKEQPVAPEVDIPAGLRKATVVRVVRRMNYGSWRWHVENPSWAHAPMLHRNSLYVRMKQFPAFIKEMTPQVIEGEDGAWLSETGGEPGMRGDYPGLGKWPIPRWTEGLVTEGMYPLDGVTARDSIRLPATTRITHFPLERAMYYEWYVQCDPDHYLYFQVCCGYPRTWFERASFLVRYYVWGRPAGMIRFNAQDLLMVAEGHEYVKRHGNWIPPARLYRPDIYWYLWRDYVVKYARGVDRAALSSKASGGPRPQTAGSAIPGGAVAAKPA